MIPYFEISKLVLKGRDMIVRRDDPLSSVSFGVRVSKSQQDLAIDFDAYIPITDVFETIGTFIGNSLASSWVTVDRTYKASGRGYVFGNTFQEWMEFLTIVALFRNESAMNRIQKYLGTIPDTEYIEIPVGDPLNSGWYKGDDAFLLVPPFPSPLILKTPITTKLKYSDYLLDMPIPIPIPRHHKSYHPYAPNTLLMSGGHTVFTGDPYLDIGILVSKMEPWKYFSILRPAIMGGDSYHWRDQQSRTVSNQFFQRLYCDRSLDYGVVLNSLKEKGLIKGWSER